MRASNKLLGELKTGLVDGGTSGDLESRWRSIQHYITAFLFEPDEQPHQTLKSSDYVEAVFPVGLGPSKLKSCCLPWLAGWCDYLECAQ